MKSLEDLQNDTEPFGVAAAARATRGLATPTPVIASALTVDTALKQDDRGCN